MWSTFELTWVVNLAEMKKLTELKQAKKNIIINLIRLNYKLSYIIIYCIKSHIKNKYGTTIQSDFLKKDSDCISPSEKKNQNLYIR